MRADVPASPTLTAGRWAYRDVRWRVDDMLRHPAERAGLDRDLLAVHGFARLVQGLSAEHDPVRDAVFDAAEHDLCRVYDGVPDNSCLRALQPVVREHDIPLVLLQQLIDAHRDYGHAQISSQGDLRVILGRMTEPLAAVVLHLFGVPNTLRTTLLGLIFTGLRIMEHLQDLTRGVVHDRILLPHQDMRLFGCYRSDFLSPYTPPQIHRLVRYEADYAALLLDLGEPLLHQLTGPARVTVARYVASGRAAVDVVHRANIGAVIA